MGAVTLEIGLKPGQPVLARGRSVRPEVRAPDEPGGGAAVVIQVAGDRVDRPAVHLIGLGRDQPLNGNAGFIGIRLGVELRRRVAGVDAAGKEDDLEVRIADLAGPDGVGESPLQGVSIGIGVRKSGGRLDIRLLQPDRLDLGLGQAERRELLVPDAVIVLRGRADPGGARLPPHRSIHDGQARSVEERMDGSLAGERP